MKKKVLIATLALSATVLTACSGMNAMPDVAEAVKVPSGNVVAMRALGTGDLTYEMSTCESYVSSTIVLTTSGLKVHRIHQ